VGKCAYGLFHDEAGVVKNLLKLGGRGAVMRRQVRLASQLNGVWKESQALGALSCAAAAAVTSKLSVI
jgi:hypothetical protein